MTVKRAAGAIVFSAILGVAALGATGAGSSPAHAAATALDKVRAGYTDLQRKRYDDAIAKFSAALSTGELARAEMAKALYYRGIAYRKSNQAAKAITDFSSALWLKDGLSPTQKTDAIAQRTAAYSEAGAASAPPVVANRSKAATPPAPSSARGWQTSTAPRGGAPSSATTQAPAATKPDPVTSFFTSLFGGGAAGQQQSADQRQVPQTTSSVGGATSSSWSSRSRVAAPVRQTPESGKSNGDGRYAIQVAALRSHAAAEALVRKLSRRHGSTLKGRRARVVPKAFGSMGTLYQVRIEAFASKSQLSPVCRTLRADGLDCLIQKR